MGHKTRHRRQRQRVRSAERHDRLFSPKQETSSVETTSPPLPSGPRVLNLSVKGGWSMSFKFTGTRVHFDSDNEPEHQHLRERTLAEVLRRGRRGDGGEDAGEA
jgi:hypothetical protein